MCVSVCKVRWLICYKADSYLWSTCLLFFNGSTWGGLEAGKLLHILSMFTSSLGTYSLSSRHHRAVGQLDKQGRNLWPVAFIASRARGAGAKTEGVPGFLPWNSFSKLRKLLSSPNRGRWRWQFCREVFPLNQGQSYPSSRIRQRSADLHSCSGSLFSVFTTLLSGPSLNSCSFSRT